MYLKPATVAAPKRRKVMRTGRAEPGSGMVSRGAVCPAAMVVLVVVLVAVLPSAGLLCSCVPVLSCVFGVRVNLNEGASLRYAAIRKRAPFVPFVEAAN